MSEKINDSAGKVILYVAGYGLESSQEFESIPYCLILSHDGMNRILSRHRTLEDAKVRFVSLQKCPGDILLESDPDGKYTISIANIIDNYCCSNDMIYFTRDDARVCSFRI